MRPNITAIIRDKKGRVLSIAKNSYLKTHPYQAKVAKKAGQPARIYLHAEVAAIVKLRDPTRAHSIDIIRVDSSGSPRLAKPCPCCALAIAQSGIKEITYTTG